MKLVPTLVFASLIALPSLVARADEHHSNEHHSNEHHEARPQEQHLPPRSAPPAFRAHPPGAHPTNNGWHQPVHPHAVRVMKPHSMHYGEHPWRHWGHPEFARPTYYWDWGAVRSVTCVAEDSYGDQYPVTESTFAGFGLVNMTAVEDDALDRCYQESGGDQGCYLATCTHF